MEVKWYFDFVSPFSYLVWPRVRSFSLQFPIVFKPILFAGLLDLHGHKGAAEIDAKRRFTYQYVVWRARELGVDLRFPPAHPFNPLAALRLCIAAGATEASINAIFDHIWRKGLRGDDADSLVPVAERLGVALENLQAPEVKARLQENFNDALKDEVFGVPTFILGNDLFWGEDASRMFIEATFDPHFFSRGEMARVSKLPMGAARPGAMR